LEIYYYVPTLYGTCPSQVLSSFEVYKKEVLSGSLDWTPMHTSVRPLPDAACASSSPSMLAADDIGAVWSFLCT